MVDSRIQCKPLVARVDYLVYIKAGHSFWTHLVPFAIAALLLLTLSMPTDNLLLKLVMLLQRPNWIWLPAIFLTAIAAAVYVLSINAQIRQAYLWPDGDLRRTIGTSLAYIILCGCLAFIVLRSALPRATTLGDIWACFLLAIFSLTGIGWSGPSSWVTSIGVKPPDYTSGRLHARRLTQVLQRVRSEERSHVQHVKDFLAAAKSLRTSIEDNLELEPEWERHNLRAASVTLNILVEQVEKQFLSNKQSIEDFAGACRCERESQYRDFVNALRNLSDYWHKWRCPNVDKGMRL